MAWGGDKMNDDEAPARASRRAVLLGAGAVATAVLGGCATYDQNAPAGPPVEDPEEPGEEDPNAQETEGPPPALAQTADIPVGGGKVLENQRLVITQPTKGEFKCFTAVCTHQGCLVAEVAGGTINCPCHGSKFKISDGSVATGPAVRPLRSVGIAVEGDAITRA
jgi:Rieske Fe-S protein